MGLSVSGGRVSKPGVAGLTTGGMFDKSRLRNELTVDQGGISYFSTRKGFVCDNVVNYEVVLASGEIVNANAQQHRDLWLALKGGSNNFGIVTRFDLITFQQGQLWGGSVYYDPSTFPQQLKALFEWDTDPNYDEFAHVIVSYGYGRGAFVAANNLYYTKATVNPTSLRSFTSIQPPIFNNLRIANLTDFTDEQAAFSTDGIRQAITRLPSYHLGILERQPGTDPIVRRRYLLARIPTHSARHDGKVCASGRKSLGLDPTDGPLMLMLLASTWASPNDDSRIIRTQQELLDRVNKAAAVKGLDSRFRYLNYAYADEDPISGFGPQNQARLQATSRKYDPDAFFQKAVPGGFKLSI
ncbi:hypothetical protein MMC22_009858 [Lobaria immixta]|nr:hypothetical protein [Lobaria immixta]